MGLLTLSSFATKLLSFFLVPLYTAILTTQEYGTYDVISSTVNFLIPILTINIYEAVLRYAMDKESDPKTVFSIGCKYAIWGNVIVVILLVFNHIARLSAILDAYSIFFALLFFVTVFSGIITSMARGLDRIADISISSVLCSVVMIFLNIFLLCVLKIGIYGYFIANISGILIQNIYLTVRIKGWNYITKTREYNSALEKEITRHCNSFPQDVTYLGQILNINIVPTYVVYTSKNSRKYHSNPHCSGIKNVKKMELNKAKQLGFVPCKRCN